MSLEPYRSTSSLRSSIDGDEGREDHLTPTRSVVASPIMTDEQRVLARDARHLRDE
jgi:hypothetical protein